MSGLAVKQSGDIQVGKFTLSKIGIEVVAPPSFDEWQDAVAFAQRAESGVAWWIGDLLNYGEAQFGEMYTQAMDATGLAYQTLADAKYVARRVEFSVRTENLSFSHHKIVAAMDQKDQTRWLKKASANSWSSADLRKAIKESNTATIPASPTEPERPQEHPGEDAVVVVSAPKSDADESKASLLDDMGIPVQDHAAEAFLAVPMFDELLKILRQARTLYAKLAEHPGGAYLRRPGVSINAKDAWRHKGIQDAIAALEDCKPSLTVCPRAYHLLAFPDCKDQTPHSDKCTLCRGLNWTRKMAKGEVAPEVEAKIKEVHGV